jgi:hypothetical protein
MKLLVLTDGTVPVVLTRVLHEDGFEDLLERDDVDDHIFWHRVFEVPDDSRYAVLSWFDGNGFDLAGYTDRDESWQAFSEDAEGIAPVGPGHFSATIEPGDDEGYVHWFELS